jgi:hypothetical protein
VEDGLRLNPVNQCSDWFSGVQCDRLQPNLLINAELPKSIESVGGGRATGSNHVVTELQEMCGQVAAILAGDATDQGGSRLRGGGTHAGSVATSTVALNVDLADRKSLKPPEKSRGYCRACS